MSEIGEILDLIKRNNIKFPFSIGILSRSIRSISESGDNPMLYIVEKTELFKNGEDLDMWLTANTDKKHILLMPESAATTARREAAKKTNAILKNKNPNHYSEAAKKRWNK